MSKKPDDGKYDPATPLLFVIACCAIALGVIAYMILAAEGVLP